MDFFGVVKETTFLINRGRKKRAVIIYQSIANKKDVELFKFKL